MAIIKSLSVPEQLLKQFDEARGDRSFNGLVIELIRLFVSQPEQIRLMIWKLSEPKTKGRLK